MKRFLSWITLIACYVGFGIIVNLDMMLLSYLAGLYGQLSAFLKLIIIVIGGSFIFGLAVAPLWYGIPLTYSASEAVCPSRLGVRYIVMGILILLSSVLEILSGFKLVYILYVVYGIALIVYGNSKSNP